MRWRPGSIREIAQRIGIPAGTGSAGLFGGLALTHNTVAAIGVALGLTAAASLPKVFESIYKRRPAILKAKGDAKADCIRAAAEAAALAKRTEIQSEIARSGLEPGNTEPAIELLRQLAINPDLPPGRRLNDEVLAKLLTPSKTKSVGTKPDSGPQSVVRPIR